MEASMTTSPNEDWLDEILDNVIWEQSEDNSTIRDYKEAKAAIQQHIVEAKIEELMKWRPMIRRLSEYVDRPDSLIEYDERIAELNRQKEREG
jgi:hypothetical protein